jgi:hypothetical protein
LEVQQLEKPPLPNGLGVVLDRSDAGSIPTLASISNCVCSNELGTRESATDTNTDTSFPTP